MLLSSNSIEIVYFRAETRVRAAVPEPDMEKERGILAAVRPLENIG